MSKRIPAPELIVSQTASRAVPVVASDGKHSNPLWRRMARRRHVPLAIAAALAASLAVAVAWQAGGGERSLDARLADALREQGFTGRIDSTLEARLGRRLDPRLANIGRLLWFDTITGLNGDNTCAGCHSPTNGFGDSQPIAIGIESNGLVGPDRSGPRNMRRAPSVINTAFYPRLMWNSRFESLSGDPFDNAAGFLFPPPEGTSLSALPHLLDAQAFIPPTERNEVAGFDFAGDNDAIRAEVLRRLEAVPEYRQLFGRVYEDVRRGAPITYPMFAAAIAEFEFSLTFANAPVDRFARGERDALSDAEKRGALLFFGKAGCVSCHAVAGVANEMFSDFREHVLAVPQLVPRVTNSTFAGPDANEDFGREDVSGDAGDRYAFRTSPLRNAAVQAAFMHDGAFRTLAAAIRHHLDVVASVRAYDAAAQGLPPDLSGPMAPLDPVLARVDPLVATPRPLSDAEFGAVLAFVEHGLLDPRALPERLRHLVPERLPSGRQPLMFEFAR
jgi:cytochrome c peroxidase